MVSGTSILLILGRFFIGGGRAVSGSGWVLFLNSLIIDFTMVYLVKFNFSNFCYIIYLFYVI